MEKENLYSIFYALCSNFSQYLITLLILIESYLYFCSFRIIASSPVSKDQGPCEVNAIIPFLFEQIYLRAGLHPRKFNHYQCLNTV